MVDMIVQNVSSDGATDISFTVPLEHLDATRPITEAAALRIGATSVEVDEQVGRVSIVGSGMRAHPGVAATMFTVLADAGINIAMISTSSIRVSCVIAASQVDEAVRRLHDAFITPELETT